MSPAREIYTKLCVLSLCGTVTADPAPSSPVPTLSRQLDEDIYDMAL